MPGQDVLMELGAQKVAVANLAVLCLQQTGKFGDLTGSESTRLV